MRASASPQLRYLLRASFLFLALLALWWWVLLAPLLSGLRLSTEAILHFLPGGSTGAGITVDPNAGWIVRVPVPASLAGVEAVQRTFGRTPGAPPVKVHSFKLAITPTVPTFFTMSLPLFWAMVLAAPRSRQFWRVFAIGTAILAVVAILSLLLYTAFTIQSNMQLVTSAAAYHIWRAAEYMNLNVIPYAAPLLLALWLHRELRTQILSWEPVPASEPAAPSAPLAAKSGRGRYRGGDRR